MMTISATNLSLMCVLAMTLVVGPAMARPTQVRVDKVMQGGSVVTTYYSSGQTIPITANQVNRVHVYSDPTGDLTNIGLIEITGSITDPLEIEIGDGPTFPVNGDIQSPAGTDWAGLSCAEPSKIYVAGHITGDLTGSVEVGHIWRLDVEGAVDAPITTVLDSFNFFTRGLFYLGEVTENGPISVEGDLVILDVAGDVHANVTSEARRIIQVYIDGDLGDASFDPEEQPIVGSHDAMGIVNIGGSVYGTIDANYHLFYDDIQSLDIGGDLHGKVEANVINTMGVPGGPPLGVRIAGDLNGRIALYKGLDHDIVIEGGFGPDAEIYLEEDGLRAQITFNGGNDGGEWDSPYGVWVGFVDAPPYPPLFLLDEPYYPELPEDLGGGSVGLAPFNMHATACVPADGETRGISAGLLINGVCLFQCDAEEYDEEDDDWFAFAVVRHYGPVEWASGVPFTVKRRSLACGGSETWTNVTSSFDFAINSGSGDREIKVTYTGSGAPDWPLDYEYLIEPVAGVLKSKGVSGAPDVADYDYKFSLIADCGESFMSLYDRNHDDALCSADIVAWSLEPTDLNEDAVADEADLALLWEVVQTHGN